MSVNKLEGIIRYDQINYQTPNIPTYLGDGFVEVYLENFRKNQQKVELVLFFKFNGEIYFPLWFEFRSINNNLLFLFKEYDVSTFKELHKILLSSLQKEEKYQAEIKAIVYQTKKIPPHSIKLNHFSLDEEDAIWVEEE